MIFKNSRLSDGERGPESKLMSSAPRKTNPNGRWKHFKGSGRFGKVEVSETDNSLKAHRKERKIRETERDEPQVEHGRRQT